MSWACQIHRSKDQELEGFEGLTVGEVFFLKCSGEEIWEILRPEQLKLHDPEGGPYDFKILEVQKLSASGAELFATTYKAPSEEGPPALVLTDGAHQVPLTLEPLVVASVLPQDQAEPPVPFGPYGPFVLGWPLWLLLLILPLLALVVTPVALLWKRTRRAAQVKKALEESGGLLSPLENFHKTQRSLVKSLYVFKSGALKERQEVLGQMKKSLTDYILQEFKALPGNQLKGAEGRVVKKALRPGAAAELMAEVRLLWREIERAEVDAENVSYEEAQRLITMTRGVVVQLNSNLRKKGAARGVA